MPKTYEPIQTQTLGSTATSVTFSSIPATYTDLVIVGVVSGAGDQIKLQFNGDTSSIYSYRFLYGNGTSALSAEATGNNAYIRIGQSYTSNLGNFICNVLNYSNTTTYKSVLSRAGNAGNLLGLFTGTWRSTAAVTSIKFELLSGSFDSGSTFTLYGIKAA
jgi:hypothetical protein